MVSKYQTRESAVPLSSGLKLEDSTIVFPELAEFAASPFAQLGN